MRGAWNKIRTEEADMAPDQDDESRENFDYFSSEYAQALQTLKTIETQSSTLMLLGGSDNLRTFIDQFIEMATRVKNLAVEKNETNFAEWFKELIDKADSIRDAVRTV